MTIQIEVDHRAALSPVRDQGARPTCLSHAVTVAHEKTRLSTIQLSPEYLHFFASSGRVTSGVSFSAISRALEEDGQPLETDCPYWNSDPSPTWRPASRLKVFRRASESKSTDLTEVEQIIRGGNLPILGITLPIGFFSPIAPWIIAPEGPTHGRHAIAGVGLASNNGSALVLIRNSWGSDWGDGGYAFVDETFISQHLKQLLFLTADIRP